MPKIDPVSAVAEGVGKITDLISEFIEDPDKRNAISLEMAKLEHAIDVALLNTKTSPFVDGLVKILIATRDIIIPMLRPLGSFAMAGFGAYCAAEGIELPEYIQAALFGAPVAWGASRHAGKREAEKTQRAAIQAARTPPGEPLGDWDTDY